MRSQLSSAQNACDLSSGGMCQTVSKWHNTNVQSATSDAGPEALCNIANDSFVQAVHGR